MGCHRSLSGVFRINPWNYEEVANTIRTALVMTSQERRVSHYRRYKHVMTHTFYNWAIGFIKDLKTAALNTYSNDKQMVQFGDFSNLRLMYVSNDLVKLKSSIATEKLINSFKRCKKRILLFDYGGTLTDTYYTDNPNCIILTQREKQRFNNNSSIDDIDIVHITELKETKQNEDDTQFDEIINYLSVLASDPMTYVGIVSGATRPELEAAFKKCDKNIMLVSEKGAFYKWPGMEIGEWQKNESLNELSISKWKQIAYDVMEIYCEKCDGSYIQEKATALVWHYFAADPEYGNMQAVELERYLKRLLDWYHNVTFQRYDHSRLLEILPKDIHKGTAAMTILDNIVTEIEKEKHNEGNEDKSMDNNDIFMLSVGNDRSDEKMFEAIELAKEELNAQNNVFTISIGLKPTQSQYYLSNQMDIIWLLQTLCNALQQKYAEQAAKQREQQQLNNNCNDNSFELDTKEENESELQQQSHMEMKYMISKLLRQQQIKKQIGNNLVTNDKNEDEKDDYKSDDNPFEYGMKRRLSINNDDLTLDDLNVEVDDDDDGDNAFDRVRTPQIDHLVSPSPLLIPRDGRIKDHNMFSIESNISNIQ